MTALPGVYNTAIRQGMSWRRQFTWTDAADALVNLTGYTAAMHIRRHVADTDPLLALTQASGITLGGAAGTIVVVITDEQADTLPAPVSKAVYDLKLTSPGGEDTFLVAGTLRIDPAVTR